MLEMSSPGKRRRVADQAKAGEARDVKGLIKNYEITKKAIVATKLANAKPIKRLKREAWRMVQPCTIPGRYGVALGCFDELALTGGGQP